MLISNSQTGTYSNALKMRSHKNNAPNTYVGTVSSFCLPAAIFNIGYATKPNASPVEILVVNGIITTIRNAGNQSEKSNILIRLSWFIISAPVIMITGEIAAWGTYDNNGIKNIDSANIIPATIDVNPVRPPLSIAEALSAAATVGLVPKIPESKLVTELA